MRITGGAFKGRSLFVPNNAAVRPTTDMVRQALFNVLTNNPDVRPLTGARVLDLFAGSGALGFEALSRGASHVTFVERTSAVTRVLSQNIYKLNVASITRIICQDALSVNLRENDWDFVFLDPPYRSGLTAKALTHLHTQGWLKPGTTIVVEQEHTETLPTMPSFLPWFERIYGKTKINILTFG